MDRGAWGDYRPWILKELDMTERLSTHTELWTMLGNIRCVLLLSLICRIHTGEACENENSHSHLCSDPVDMR